MEPFTIQCSTCQSLIRVRNPKMIGQIVNCPKCNSMLQIASPEVSKSQHSDGRQIRVESHRGVIDSSAMTKEAFAPELEDEYRLSPSPVTGPTAERAMNSSSKLVAPPRVDDEPMPEATFQATPLPSQKLASPQFASPPAGQPATESNHIQLMAVRRTARRRQVLMVAVMGSSGVLLAGMLFVGFLYWYTSKPTPAIASNSSNANQKHVGPKRESEQNVFQDPLAESDLDPLDSPTPPTEASPDPSEPTVASAEPTREANSISTAVESAIKPSEETPPRTVDQPENLDTLPSEQTAAPNTAVDTKSTAELPDQLKKFQSILSTTIEPQFLEDQAIQKAPPTAKELGLSSGQDAKALPAVDVAKQIKTTITGLIIPPGSITNAVSQWVQVSGIPTVVDLDSLAAADIDPYKSIGRILVSADSPLEQVAASIAKEIGVESKAIENQFLVLQAPEETVRQHLPTSIKINDLVDNDQQQWLIKTLDKIWPEYEGKWIVRDDELTVDPVVVDTLAWFWAVRMLESWRLAAGVETQLDKSKLDQSKVVTKFVDPEKLPGLNTPLSLTLTNRAAVSQIVTEIGAASKMHVWVDWASVGHKGLGPNSIDFMVTKDRILRQCLRDLTEKYSLVAACEAESSIFLTTNETYRASPRLYVFPSQGNTAEQWIDELQPLTPATTAAAQPVQAYLTPGGEFVIVRCCRPRIRT